MRLTVLWLHRTAFFSGSRDRSLNTGRHRRTALLEAWGTSVTGEASNTILTGTLACGLVTGFASSTNWMAITSSASTAVTQDTAWVTIEALPAVVAVSTSSIVPAIEAHTPTAAAGQSVQLHVEAASSGMAVAGASKASVGFLPCSPLPWPVAVEGLAAATIRALCTMLAVADQMAMAVQQTP